MFRLPTNCLFFFPILVPLDAVILFNGLFLVLCYLIFFLGISLVVIAVVVIV